MCSGLASCNCSLQPDLRYKYHACIACRLISIICIWGCHQAKIARLMIVYLQIYLWRHLYRSCLVPWSASSATMTKVIARSLQVNSILRTAVFWKYNCHNLSCGCQHSLALGDCWLEVKVADLVNNNIRWYLISSMFELKSESVKIVLYTLHGRWPYAALHPYNLYSVAITIEINQSLQLSKSQMPACYSWEHRQRIQRSTSPGAYLYRRCSNVRFPSSIWGKSSDFFRPCNHCHIHICQRVFLFKEQLSNSSVRLFELPPSPHF